MAYWSWTNSLSEVKRTGNVITVIYSSEPRPYNPNECITPGCCHTVTSVVTLWHPPCFFLTTVWGFITRGHPFRGNGPHVAPRPQSQYLRLKRWCIGDKIRYGHKGWKDLASRVFSYWMYGSRAISSSRSRLILNHRVIERRWQLGAENVGILWR